MLTPIEIIQNTMSRCPEKCNTLTEQIFISATPEDFVKAQAEHMKGRKGIGKVEWGVIDNTPILTVFIEQDDYKTYNYFKHRDWIEGKESITVRDVRDKVVSIQYDAELVLPANRCTNCNSVFGRYCDGDETVVDVSNSDNWLSAHLL